ncbi:MAG TPA: PIN domain-containing protein [Candidatus Limnocylindrales bacterium]|nr:PIN domain-containing protein [Candidatus Limnocylindrales bacterium]
MPLDFIQNLVLYLDTNLFLDLTRNRKNDFSRQIFQDIKNGKYDAVTSTFTLLEIIQEEQERKFAENELIHNKRSFDEIRIRIHDRNLTRSALEEVYDSAWKELNPYIETEKIRVAYLDEDGWDVAADFQKQMNISASDVIHVAVAYIERCDVFVTSDSQLIAVGSSFFKPKTLIFSTPEALGKNEKRIRTTKTIKLQGKQKKVKEPKTESLEKF